MKITMKNLSTILLSTMFVLTLGACSDGPGETTGEKVDKIVTDAGNAIEDTCEDIKDNVDAKDKDC